MDEDTLLYLFSIFDEKMQIGEINNNGIPVKPGFLKELSDNTNTPVKEIRIARMKWCRERKLIGFEGEQMTEQPPTRTNSSSLDKADYWQREFEKAEQERKRLEDEGRRLHDRIDRMEKTNESLSSELKLKQDKLFEVMKDYEKQLRDMIREYEQKLAAEKDADPLRRLPAPLKTKVENAIASGGNSTEGTKDWKIALADKAPETVEKLLGLLDYANKDNPNIDPYKDVRNREKPQDSSDNDILRKMREDTKKRNEALERRRKELVVQKQQQQNSQNKKTEESKKEESKKEDESGATMSEIEYIKSKIAGASDEEVQLCYECSKTKNPDNLDANQRLADVVNFIKFSRQISTIGITLKNVITKAVTMDGIISILKDSKPEVLTGIKNFVEKDDPEKALVWIQPLKKSNKYKLHIDFAENEGRQVLIEFINKIRGGEQNAGPSERPQATSNNSPTTT